MLRPGCRHARETYGFTWSDWLAYFFPLLGCLRRYNVRGWLASDVVAGLTVGAMAIPQAMSYAKLAGLPQEFGEPRAYSSLAAHGPRHSA